MEGDSSCLIEEVEALRAIYVHELLVECIPGSKRPSKITIDLHPATADKADQQYVRLTLIITLSQQYPEVSPEILICNSRGLADEDINKISEDLKEITVNRKGSPMLYEMIEYTKEYLTKGNTPKGQCAICLYGFTNQDILTKTDCYHHFHSHCLARYIQATLDSSEDVHPLSDQNKTKKVVCPVCRESITYDLESLQLAPPPQEIEKAPDFTVLPELEERQKEMAAIYARQKACGGIIDVEAERNKFLLEISSELSEPDPNACEDPQLSSNSQSPIRNNGKTHHTSKSPSHSKSSNCSERERSMEKQHSSEEADSLSDSETKKKSDVQKENDPPDQEGDSCNENDNNSSERHQQHQANWKKKQVKQEEKRTDWYEEVQQELDNYSSNYPAKTNTYRQPYPKKGNDYHWMPADNRNDMRRGQRDRRRPHSNRNFPISHNSRSHPRRDYDMGTNRHEATVSESGNYDQRRTFNTKKGWNRPQSMGRDDGYRNGQWRNNRQQHRPQRDNNTNAEADHSYAHIVNNQGPSTGYEGNEWKRTLNSRRGQSSATANKPVKEQGNKNSQEKVSSSKVAEGTNNRTAFPSSSRPPEQRNWGYGPPPSGFQACRPPPGFASSTTTNLTPTPAPTPKVPVPPPGFCSKPPFPRPKPPPGFLTS